MIDLLVAIGILLIFLRPALSYEGPMGQFPRVFLITGLLFLCIELVIHFLPEPYRGTLQTFTSGLTDEMSDEMESEVDDADEASDSDMEPTEGLFENDIVMLGSFIGILIGFFIVSYLVGFLIAIPLFTFGIVYLFGSWDLLVWIGITMFLMALVYGLFGEVMNVPIMDGELL